MEFLSEHAYVWLFLLSFLASSIVPVGSEWLLVIQLLEGESPALLIATATAGNALGACTTFLLGHLTGPWVTTTLLRQSPESMERAHRMFKQYGIWSLLFSWAPIIGDPLCLVSAILKTPFPRFFLFMFMGKLIRYWVVGFATLRAMA